MLADEMTLLLTAYVDGELSPRERQAALRLLHESSAARALLAQLQENAHKLQKLPRRALDPAFTADVLRTIAARKVEPERVRRPVLRLRWVPYAVAGMAATVLFVATLGSALFLAEQGDWFRAERVIPGNGVANVAPPEPAPVKPGNPKADPPPRKSNPLIAQVIDGAMQCYAAPIPDRSVSVRFQDLKKDADARQLAAELKKAPAVQLDVTVHNQAQAVARLQDVLKMHGIKLAVDPASGFANNKAGKGPLLVYAENVPVDELTKIFAQLGTAEKKTASPFDKLTVASLSAQDHRQVAGLLGIDPTKREPGGTQGMIQGGAKPKPGKKVERVAVVLPQAPATTASDAVRQFLYQPARPQPGSVRILLRIRQE